MANSSATSNWVVKIPPPVWTFAMLLIAYGLERSFGWAARVYISSLPLAILVTVTGIGVMVWGERMFAAAGTEIMPASPANRKLVTGGPFRFTRNPMYLGLVLATAGVALYMGTLAFFAIPVLLFLLCNFVFIPFEEAKMQRQHSGPYTEYLRLVRRWI